ncbi:LOW QUALITY PROTEIN: adenylylsulfatase HINT3 [Carica papaya]|uniref:LOW QUALITY PROTEIN: adenylylsulfatase HINT3 n=1 Tax=Carica papaya TaxID=3649 RepID=UPI000B8C775A|nr:LOW QUALITY PROTEIN: adenylylsulfatase HINT3 [Carica papaya]
METLRLAIICSHLRPIGPRSSQTRLPTPYMSGCAAGSNEEPPPADSKSGSPENDCIFCKIIRGESPSLKLYEDDMCLCILDVNPLSRGHSLIIPKSHFSSLEATPPSVVAAMCSKVPFISNAIMKATGSDSFNLLVNNGAAAGQVIFHTHIHIIPRKERDCLWASESLHRRPLKLDKEASQLANHVREWLSSRLEYSKSQDSSHP